MGYMPGVLPATVVTARGRSLQRPLYAGPCPPTLALQEAHGSLPGMCGLLCLRGEGCFRLLLRSHRGLRGPGQVLAPSAWPSLL